jgi:lysophospholipase L1-like esterase
MKKTGLKLFIHTLFSLFIFFCLFEFGSRCYELYNNEKFTDKFDVETKTQVASPFLVFRFKNNISDNSYDSNFSTNSFGFRGKEFEIVKPKDVFRIIAIGDSCTFGFGASDDEHTYPYLLEAKLNSMYKNKKIEVINAGVPSYKSLQSLIWLVTELMGLNPDMLIVQLGWNDIVSIFSPEYTIKYGYEGIFVGKARFEKTPSPKTDFITRLSEESAAFRQMLKWSYKLKKHFNRAGVADENIQRDEAKHRLGITLYTKNPYYLERILNIYRRSLLAISLLAKNEGVKVVLVKSPFLIREDSSDKFLSMVRERYPENVVIEEKDDYYTRFRFMINKEIYRIIDDVSLHSDSLIFDAAALFPHNEELCFEYFHDNAHLTDKGNDFFARQLADFIFQHHLFEKNHKRTN